MRYSPLISVYILFFLLAGTGLRAAPVPKGFEALAIYDYFKARKFFYKATRKKPDPYACYGLATIYYRRDNPFHNVDSAIRYVQLGAKSFKSKPFVKTLAGFTIHEQAFVQLADSIFARKHEWLRKKGESSLYNQFFEEAWMLSDPLRSKLVLERDRLDLNQVKQVNNSGATREFLKSHPGSELTGEAQKLLEKQVYDEQTSDKTADSYLRFLRAEKINRMRNQAYEKLFDIYSRNRDTAGLAIFVKEFPDAPQNMEAWKLLFSLSTKSYSFAGVKKFLDQYPGFPLKNTILHELELNKLVLYPFVRGEMVGYITDSGELRIPCEYDAGTLFSEGLAVVQKNDNAYFINKENVDPFNRSFEEAGLFRNGLAPVKTGGGWYLLNRLGQQLAGPFEEMSEMSDEMYVIKMNGHYGALDKFGEQVIAPRYDKLGDFRNGYAYCSDGGRSGFISKQGQVTELECEWMSDFSPAGFAVFKRNNRFGLVSTSGEVVLEPQYDQLLKQGDSLYLPVHDEKYGYFDIRGCFQHFVGWDYMISLQAGKGSDGNYFRLNRKGQQSVSDANGSLLAAFGTYDEVFVPSDDLMRVKKKGKFGYADLRGNLVRPCIYSEATDFVNGTAIVKKKDEYALINKSGKELMVSSEQISRMGGKYLVTGEEVVTIFDHEGTVLHTEISNLQELAPGVYAGEKGGQILIFSK